MGELSRGAGPGAGMPPAAPLSSPRSWHRRTLAAGGGDTRAWAHRLHPPSTLAQPGAVTRPRGHAAGVTHSDTRFPITELRWSSLRHARAPVGLWRMRGSVGRCEKNTVGPGEQAGQCHLVLRVPLSPSSPIQVSPAECQSRHPHQAHHGHRGWDTPAWTWQLPQPQGRVSGRGGVPPAVPFICKSTALSRWR